jgi:hypothetical protein
MAEKLVDNILCLLAERKIAEAMEQGAFENLPGKGKPLPEDDLANLPDDVRLAYRILRMAGMDSSEAEAADAPDAGSLTGPTGRPRRKRARSIMEELDLGSPSEGKAYRHLEHLRLKLGKDNPLKPEEENRLLDSGYLDKILDRLFPDKKKGE